MKYKHASQQEDIRCAAVWFDDGILYPHQPKNIETGYVLCGLRHHNCLTNRYVLGLKKVPNSIQGFLTNKDRFLNRKESAEVAMLSGQIKTKTDLLFSENLY